MEFIITEIFGMINNYVKIILFSLLILFMAFIINFIVKIHFKRLLYKYSKSESKQHKRLQKTRLEFLRVLISNIILLSAIISILFLLPGFRTFSLSLLAGAGIAAIVFGFAAQKTIANIIAGISIIIYTPFRIGDKIKVDGELGDVEDITLRHTVIRTWNNRRIFIPNAILSEKQIINYSIKEEMVLWTVDFGISYDSDINKAKKIMVKAANNHKDIICPLIKDEDGVVEKKVPRVRVTECKDSAINLKLYFWVAKPGLGWSTSFDLMETIKKEFDKSKIEIPFPHRTLVFKKDLEDKKRNKN